MAHTQLTSLITSLAHLPTSIQSCYQCEQTLNNKGCTEIGVCGKTPEVAGLQVRGMAFDELLLHVCWLILMMYPYVSDLLCILDRFFPFTRLSE